VLAAVSTEAEEVSEEAGAEPSVLVAAPSVGVSFSLISYLLLTLSSPLVSWKRRIFSYLRTGFGLSS